MLIEKARSAVTDETGQYRILELRPGTYTVTFTLTGFNTVKREQLELPADFVSTVNVELRVGTLEETVTVTGESPIVDVQSARRRRTLNEELIESLPTAQGYAAVMVLMPSMMQSNGGNNPIVSDDGYAITFGNGGGYAVLVDNIFLPPLDAPGIEPRINVYSAFPVTLTWSGLT